MQSPDHDEALISAALDGSARAWETLVMRFESRIYNFSLRLTGNETDALDLMQEVFLGIYRNLHRFRGDSQFTTWVFRIAHNKAVDMSRRRGMTSPLSALAGAEESEQDVLERLQDAEDVQDPLALLSAEQGNAQVQKLLSRLSWDQRMVVELKVFQSCTFEEIAEMQDISANTAKTRFYTAMKTLKSQLELAHVL